MHLSSIHGSVTERNHKWIVEIDVSLTEFETFEEAFEWFHEITAGLNSVVNVKQNSKDKGKHQENL